MARKQWVNGKINEEEEAEKNLFDTVLFSGGGGVYALKFPPVLGWLTRAGKFTRDLFTDFSFKFLN